MALIFCGIRYRYLLRSNFLGTLKTAQNQKLWR